ncbi:protein amnionless [Danaus plexippus]|uniref:protein amnionless n=1 Tax=Danaus plexippus TaxID=13037 RepID=UPI002AB223C8|nr:protein amnionless [Danaus plexippus]
MTLQIFIHLITVSIALCSKVSFIPNASFNLPQNFKDGRLPCSKQTVVFPNTVAASVIIESGVSVSGFILPEDGDLIIDDGIIELGEKYDDNCTVNGKAFYFEKSITSWNEPDVWISSKFNKATPDAERIPCYDDVVEFPANTTFILFLPEKTQYVRDIVISGKKYDTVTLRNYINNQADQNQRFVVNTHQDVGISVKYSTCRSPSGCPCQTETLEIDCSTKFCPEPSCVDPVQPIGHCCKICGGVMAFDVDKSFDFIKFQETVESVVKSYGKDDLVYHIGRFGNQVQLVVVDKGDYTGLSAEAVNTIDYGMEKRFAALTRYSGSPISKSGYGGKIFISMFFLVVSVLGIIYLYFYKMPQFHFPMFGRSDPRIFTRFNRRTESVVSLARKDSITPTGASSSTAFRNPLYDSIKSRSRVEESIAEN